MFREIMAIKYNIKCIICIRKSFNMVTHIHCTCSSKSKEGTVSLNKFGQGTQLSLCSPSQHACGAKQKVAHTKVSHKMKSLEHFNII